MMIHDMSSMFFLCPRLRANAPSPASQEHEVLGEAQEAHPEQHWAKNDAVIDAHSLYYF